MTLDRTAQADAQQRTHMHLPVRQRHLVSRLAKAWARVEGELDLFEADRPISPDRAGGEVFESYMGDAWDLMRASGLGELLSLAEMLSRHAPGQKANAEDLDMIEAYIAQQQIDITRIETQLDLWNSGGLQHRDRRWAEKARRAMDAKMSNLNAAHRVRLRFTRDDVMAEVVAGRDQKIVDLQEQHRIERRRRIEQGEKASASIQAAKDFVRANAPHLMGAMLERLDAAKAEITAREAAEAAALLQLADRCEMGTTVECAP